MGHLSTKCKTVLKEIERSQGCFVTFLPCLFMPNTPNIRVITIKDFRKFIHEVGFNILKEVAINTQSENRYGKVIKFLRNLRATYGIFLIGNGT